MTQHRIWLARTGAAIAVALAVGAIGTPAEAATTGSAKVISARDVKFVAGTGVVNKITTTRSGNVVTFDDRVAIKAGTGCRKVGQDVTKVACTLSTTPERIFVSTGDKNDVITDKSNIELHADAGSGNDKLYGGGGVDVLLGGSGKDLLEGGAAYDLLDGGTGADVMKGGAGDDEVNYGSRVKSVYADLDGKADDGEKGEKDTIAADVENLWGGRGDDTLIGNDKTNDLRGGEGRDTIKGGKGRDWISDTGSVSNTLLGEDGDDFIYAGSGDDIVKGGPGNDVIDGEWGNDTVDGDAGNDWLTGGQGKDVMRGGVGDDDLVGGDGDDKLQGNDGDDRIQGTGSFIFGESATELNAIDGGANTTEYGDRCYAGRASTVVNCETANWPI